MIKFILKHKRPKIAKVILSKNSSGGGINIPDFKLYYRAIRIKIKWYCPQSKYENQRRKE
jgi:hypothetical protein